MNFRIFHHRISMIRVLLALLVLVVASKSLMAQDSVVVVTKIVDKRYGDPVHNVNATITFGGEQLFKITGSRGQFRFKSPKGVAINFGFSHRKYNGTKEFKKIPQKYAYDTISFEFEMEIVKMQDVDEVTVKAPGIPDTVFESKRLSVEDFEVLPNGDMILLTYPKRLKKGSELLLYDGISEVKNSFQVPGVAQELVRDYRGNAHILCKENVFGIYADESQLSIANLDKGYFTKYILPIVDTNRTKLYFSTFNKDYPAFEYFTYDVMDSTYSKILGIEDELMMELYRAEYKWMDVRTKLWAKNLELQTGIDAEIYVGANYFTQSIYYKEVYAPLFHRNDSLFIFDYYKDLLFTFDRYGNKLDSVPIYHHYQPKRTGWQKELIQDRKTGEVYALFERSGYTHLGRINTRTGEITEHVKLEFRYVDKVAVHGNFVYYIYRPFESIQKKFLYRERLPYEFGRAKVPDGDSLTSD